MKWKLVPGAIFIAFFSLNAHAQSPIFFNKGVLSVVDNDTTKALLYISGDMAVSSDFNDPSITSQIIVNRSKVTLKGNLRNNVKTGTVFIESASNNGVFEFSGNLPQTITTDGSNYTAIPSKRSSYISFPNLRIYNNRHVIVDPKIALKTKNIDLAKGWLILDSKKTDASDYAIAPPYLYNRTMMAHLYVDGNVKYQGWSQPNVEDRGFIQVNMRLNDCVETLDTDTKSLIGFGIPFDGLKSDYFMYNYLIAPTNKGFLGDNNTTITNPTYHLQKGVGYVLGIDLQGSNPEKYTDLYPGLTGVQFDCRAKDGYYFNRFKYSTDLTRNSNNMFSANVSQEAYQIEKLNTEDIVVNLRAGYNYLSNPFMAPLDLSDLLGSNTAQTHWNVISDNADNASRDIVNRVWVLTGDASAKASASGSKYINFVYNYYVAKNVGGTYAGDYFDEDYGLTVAPLQMFVIYAAKAGQITIPKDKRVMSRVQFIRNTPLPRKDDFIVEIIDESTRTSDRASIVLRNQQDILTNKEYENVKRVVTASTTGSTRATQSQITVPQTTAGQIYTMDDAGTTAYTVQFFPLEIIKSTVLYLTPSSQPQNITLRGLRLNTISEIKEIWLEDRIQNTKTLLTPETLYQTTSQPTDRTDRFVLHFNKQIEVGIDSNEDYPDKITVYYTEGILNLSGFTPNDFGSKIYVYDMQGRVLKNSVVDNHKMSIDTTLPSGTYIVKVMGNRSLNIKLLTN